MQYVKTVVKNLGKLLIALVGITYLIIAINQFLKGNTGMAISFLGYAIGNIGLYMLAV